jgi:hypothetical protein
MKTKTLEEQTKPILIKKKNKHKQRSEPKKLKNLKTQKMKLNQKRERK